MIPIGQIVEGNLYSQDDARLLLGNGFSAKAARDVICEACRSGELNNRSWRRRYWFTGREFMDWVSRWFGAEIEAPSCGEEGPSHLAKIMPSSHNGAAKRKPVAVMKGGR